MPITKTSEALVDEAMAQVKTYSVAELKGRLGEPSLQLVDIRDVRELGAGIVAGSCHVPRGLLEFSVDPESPYHNPLFADDSKEFVLICGIGWRSALAAKTLQDMGMRNVAHMGGGFTEWLRQSGPVESLDDLKARETGDQARSSDKPDR